MTGSAPPSSPLAVFQGPVTCRRIGDVLTLTGPAADAADEVLILTFIAPVAPNLPDRLAAATVHALGAGRYSISADSREWLVEAKSVHAHRDIGVAFHRALPPRPVSLRKRLFWRVVLTLAPSRGGKRLLLSLRRQG